jgi:peroxiredoxin
MRRWLIPITVMLVGAGIYIAASVRAQSTDDEHAQHAEPAPRKPAIATPAAKTVLDTLDKAYGDLTNLKLVGKLSIDADVGGRVQQSDAGFEATFESPNRFRQTTDNDSVSGFTGEQAFIFLPRRNVYVAKALPKEKITDNALPQPLGNVLSSQNPSLLMAISKAPSEALTRGYDTIDKVTDIAIDGVAHVALVMKSDSEVATVLIDPGTTLIRRFTSDLRPLMIARGADAVKKAEFVVDYTTVTVNAAPADNASDAFAWTPPDGARDITNNLQELSNTDAAAQAMVGKPAPDFTLDSLEGPQTKLSALKGNVVILDFWATWCGPCIMAMPELSKYHDELKDKPVKLIGVNVGERKPQVAKFVKQHKVTFPIVLDTTETTAESFSVSGFPTTFIIDKEGVIRKVINAYAPGRNDRTIRQTVDQLLGQ